MHGETVMRPALVLVFWWLIKHYNPSPPTGWPMKCCLQCWCYISNADGDIMSSVEANVWWLPRRSSWCPSWLWIFLHCWWMYVVVVAYVRVARPVSNLVTALFLVSASPPWSACKLNAFSATQDQAITSLWPLFGMQLRLVGNSIWKCWRDGMCWLLAAGEKRHTLTSGGLS